MAHSVNYIKFRFNPPFSGFGTVDLRPNVAHGPSHELEIMQMSQ
jgi:hypothetical protein